MPWSLAVGRQSVTAQAQVQSVWDLWWTNGSLWQHRLKFSSCGIYGGQTAVCDSTGSSSVRVGFMVDKRQSVTAQAQVQFVWDLWWTKWHWKWFFSECFGFPPSVLFYQCLSLGTDACTHISHYSLTDMSPNAVQSDPLTVPFSRTPIVSSLGVFRFSQTRRSLFGLLCGAGWLLTDVSPHRICHIFQGYNVLVWAKVLLGMSWKLIGKQRYKMSPLFLNLGTRRREGNNFTLSSRTPCTH